MVKKRTSKRQGLRKKYKIERKVKEHHRKLRKESKFKKQKDIGIPKIPMVASLLPDITKAAEEIRENERFLCSQKSKKKEKNNNLQHSKIHISPHSWRTELYKTILASNVIVHVLDARDPLGTRCLGLEKYISTMQGDKKQILLLNKVDLVPQENVQLWLNYLKQFHPTIAFRCLLQKDKKTFQMPKKLKKVSEKDLLRTNACFGETELLSLLAKYQRHATSTPETILPDKKIDQTSTATNLYRNQITIGIVGMPNTGKSALINSLKHNHKLCGSSQYAGTTKIRQVIKFSNNMRLIDSPGLVMATSDVTYRMSEAELMLRNCIRVEDVVNPEACVLEILKRVLPQQLCMLYNLPSWNDSDETIDQTVTANFLMQVAKRFGMVRKGGVLDTHSAAKRVIVDWVTSKIKYFTIPPNSNAVPITSRTNDVVQVVSHLAPEINPFVDMPVKHAMEVEDEEQESEDDVEQLESDQGDDDEGSMSVDEEDAKILAAQLKKKQCDLQKKSLKHKMNKKARGSAAMDVDQDVLHLQVHKKNRIAKKKQQKAMRRGKA